jgi:AcrR family transcriptional regulator
VPNRGYHHGHLAEALLTAGVELARASGPDAVVLREAARRVGVSPTAAYRHFENQNGLVEAVKEHALALLYRHMQAALEAPGAPTAGPDRLAAIGRAYLEFAITEPGLFRTFCIGLPPVEDLDVGNEKKSLGPTFGVLTDVIDGMAAQGLLDPALVKTAAISAWAAVHGLAILTIDGPLSKIPPAEREGVFRGAIRMVLNGLLAR